MNARNGRNGNSLILFDVMIHSETDECGLGDQGCAGLQVFSEQHECNAICRAFGVPPAVDTWTQAIESAFEEA
ncbi:hypothetical protein BKA70DRAFT_1428700 [Coprinopsis sp. MPI-PUGE-AT-0042]|nr:hypothetical protein BKA70DRAFT_1428700 [Coprinopsis sp. MPI-PUGE-AT-0042]